MSFVQELKRRNVIRVGIAYVVASWLIVQISDVVIDNIGAPDWLFKGILLILGIGFPLAMIIAWAFELTPEGIKKEKDVDRTHSITPQTGRKLDFAIIALLAMGLGYFIWESRFSESNIPVTDAVGGRSAAESSAHTTATRKSIAALPFTTRSKVEDDQFFSDGMHDDLLTQLAKIGSLKVISRTSVMEYRDTTMNLRDIAAELGVTNILEGAIQRSGNQVRINVQLIDAQTDEHLWAEIYDRELTAENLFVIQTEIAKAIALALQTTLSPEEEERMDHAALTDNLDALKAYQRARLLLSDLEEEPANLAQQEIERALALDPDFAAAWALQARLHIWFHWNIKNDDARLALAMEAIDKGRAINPDLPELDVAEGYYYYWGFRDYENAIRVLEPVEAAYPNDADVHTLLGFVYRRQGQVDKALQQLHRAFELTPRSDEVAASLSETYQLVRDFEQAQEFLDITEMINPTGSRYYLQGGAMQWAVNGDPQAAIRSWKQLPEPTRFEVWRANIALGNFDLDQDFEAFRDTWFIGDLVVLPELMHGLTFRLSGDATAAKPYLDQAISNYHQLLESSPDDFHLLKPLCWAEGGRRNAKEAAQACQGALDNLPDDWVQRGIHRQDIAGAMALAGLNSEALDLLEIVLAESYGPSRTEIKLDPMLQSLREEPRWQALMTEQ